MQYLSATTATFSDAHYSDALQPLTFVRLRSSCLNLATHGMLLQSKTSQMSASSDATMPLTPHWMTHNQGDATMDNAPPQPPTTALILRDVIDTDLPIFFEHQLDADANYMAAFTTKNPADQAAFAAHWHKILADTTTIIKTIVCPEHVAGYVSSYEEAGRPEVTYWLGKGYWGRSIATRALREFLTHANPLRPIHARVAKDNHGSLRVLQKCGFTISGEDAGFAHARGQEVAEYLLTRHAP